MKNLIKIKLNHKKWMIIGLFLVTVTVVLFFLFGNNQKTKVLVQSSPEATIKQTKSTGYNYRAAKQITPSTSLNKGTSTDTSSCTDSTYSTKAIQSKSGVISVKIPTLNSTIKSGDAVCGKSSINKINYRLIDNLAGVISQGLINVSGNNFSATISFQAYNDSGRLDIYSMDNSGLEVNEVQIPVKFR